MKTRFICKECGSENIQIKTWYNPNTNEAGEFVDDLDTFKCWCENCQDTTNWEDILTITPEEAKRYLLKDDETETGGISFIGETLADFMESTEMSYDTPLKEIDEALKRCGIEPMFKYTY